MSFEKRKTRIGTVTSDKMDKTVDVQVEWRRAHYKYGKAMKRRSQLKAHDELNDCRLGDLVKVMETRPLSKTKRWRVVEILTRGDIAEIQPEDINIDDSETMIIPIQTTSEQPLGEGASEDVDPNAEQAFKAAESDSEAEEATESADSEPEPEETTESADSEPEPEETTESAGSEEDSKAKN